MGMNEVLIPNESKTIVLQLTEDNIASMILNFLGHKQKLYYQYDHIHFVLDRENIEQFHYLLEAKIAKEQYIHLNSFMVTINYQDKTKRTIHGLEAMQTFTETRSVIPVSITLEWKIILQFPNAPTIESQNIEVTFNISPKDNIDSIYLEIAHTNQAWGNEILSLFKDHIDSIIQEKPNQVLIAESIKKFFVPKNFSDFMTFLFLSMIPFLFLISLKSNGIDTDGLNAISKMVHIEQKQVDLRDFDLSLYLIEKKIDNKSYTESIKSPEYKNILIEYIKSKENQSSKRLQKEVSFFMFLIGIVTFSHFFLKQNYKYYGRKSFILLTKKAEQQYRQFTDSKSKLEYFSVNLLLFSILTGVIGNFAYQWLIE